MNLQLLIGYIFFLIVFYGLVYRKMHRAPTDVELWGEEED